MYLLEKGTVVPGHAMKAHKGTRHTVPFILKLSTRLEVSGQLQYCFNPMNIINAQYRQRTKLGWFTASLDAFEEDKKSLPCQKSSACPQPTL